jgi:hypothetical protein
MLIKILNGLLATATLVVLGACSTPDAASGGLYAPIQSNTSGARAADVAAQAQVPPMPPPASVQVSPVDITGTAPVGAPVKIMRVTRVGLLLPLRSDSLGAPSEALRAGFMAAFERDRDGVEVNLIDTGDSPDETLNAYMAALKNNDIIVGPLSRSAVTAVADSGTVSKPTVALNHPESGSPVPANMLVVGLSIEDEARQVARWAGAEHPRATALVVSGPAPWQKRLASAFVAQWTKLGNKSQLAELTASNGYLHESGLNQLKTRTEAEPPALVFAALDHDQLRQFRSTFGPALPAYGTSSVNPGTEPGMAVAELDGTRILDLPWQVQSDHSAVMVYPRWAGAKRTLDLDRLYALGIDAFRVARELALRPGANFRMDGVTGKLSVSFGKGPARFERVETGTVYQGGVFRLVEPGR